MTDQSTPGAGDGARQSNWLFFALKLIAAVMIFAMAALTFLDVIGRYVFAAPIQGTFEIVGLLLGVVTFSALPLVTHSRSHITVDLFEHLEGLGTALEIQDDLPEIVADREAIGRVFENLLSNAVKYGLNLDGTKISVGSQTVDGEVRYFVRDNGPGIAPEYHEKIFELFQRLDGDQDGTGVGLAIVAKIMRVHNGRVWVESSPGEGATFWLAFDSVGVREREPMATGF